MKALYNGDIGITTFGENLGTRLGFNGATRKTTITQEDLDKYREEYERFKSDPEMQRKYAEILKTYNLKG